MNEPRDAAGAGTRRLYFEDPYLSEFEAVVLERLEREGRPAAVLDRTAFYPESGGQPSDRGTLGGVPVLDVVEEAGRVVHVLGAPLPEGAAGGPVRGSVDGSRRFDHMQQHTGQHILSQAFLEVLRGETRSFHLGPEVSALEIGIRQASDDEVETVERAANRIVFEDREVRTSFVPEERIREVPLRRPPKVSGLIRIVEVAGFDWSACGGTHVRRTGEIGLVKVIGAERIRDNVRFTFVCGGRALGDYALKTRLLRRIAGQFSARETDSPAAVEKAQAELKDLRRRVKRLAETAAAAEARELVRGAAGPVLSGLLADRGPEEARALAVHVTRLGGAVALFAAAAAGRGHFLAASSGASGFDVRTLIPVVSAVIPAKGGGSPTLMELVTEKPDGLEEALEAAKAFALTRIAGK